MLGSFHPSSLLFGAKSLLLSYLDGNTSWRCQAQNLASCSLCRHHVASCDNQVSKGMHTRMHGTCLIRIRPLSLYILEVKMIPLNSVVASVFQGSKSGNAAIIGDLRSQHVVPVLLTLSGKQTIHIPASLPNADSYSYNGDRISVSRTSSPIGLVTFGQWPPLRESRPRLFKGLPL